MNRITILPALVALILAVSGCTNAIVEAVSDTSRLPEAVERDAVRQPAEMLKLSGIKKGDQVVEIAAAGGYYTALLSRVVGETGKVYAVDPERIFEHFPRGREGFPAYIDKDPRNNVEYSIQLLDKIDIPGNINQVWMVLYYHDTVWTGEDRAAMNKAFYDMLVPGGTYFIIDHHAVSDAPDSVTQELHRIDADVVRREVEAAGFTLRDESNLLSNSSDPRNDSVFAEERRGQTDRFVWRYTKPR